MAEALPITTLVQNPQYVLLNRIINKSSPHSLDYTPAESSLLASMGIQISDLDKMTEKEMDTLFHALMDEFFGIEHTEGENIWNMFANNLQAIQVSQVRIMGANYFEKPIRSTKTDQAFVKLYPEPNSPSVIPTGCVGELFKELTIRGIRTRLEASCLFPEAIRPSTQQLLSEIEKS